MLVIINLGSSGNLLFIIAEFDAGVWIQQVFVICQR